MVEPSGSGRIQPAYVVLLVALVAIVVGFGALVLTVGEPRGWGPSGDAGWVVRALPAPPADAPVGDQYQELLNAEGRGRFEANVAQGVDVEPGSIEFVGTSIGPFEDVELYRFMARFDDGGMDHCSSSIGESWGGTSCGPPGGGPSVGGGSAQSGDGPTIESLDVTGLEPEARWARAVLDSGLIIIGDVREGMAHISWTTDSLVVIEVYNADLELLWSEEPDWG